MSKIPNRIMLTEDELPQQWYNIQADMPEKHDPFLNPQTLKPSVPEDLYPVFAEELCKQEFTLERYIDIPEEVQEKYKMYRPSPLCRAYALEKALGTPAKIYYKYEGSNTSGSHKLNSAIPQAYYNKMQGIERLTTETGAGQWGTALAMACAFYDIPLRVYMVKISAEQKPYRKAVIETYGGNVFPSPSTTTAAGRAVLAVDPNCTGSLGTAISEAVEMAITTPNTRYVLGSVLNQVVLHQSIIGIESKLQMEKIGEYPDIIIGCAGGGSNLGGLMSEYMHDKLIGKANPYFIAVEPAACPSLTKGKYAYDYCDTAKVTPLAKMYTLGSGYIPSSIHAGGLRYHGMSPIVSKLYHDKYIDEARAVMQNDIFKAAVLFAKTEAILPAPESSHAIRVAVDEALKCKETGEAKTILFGLTGNGSYDLSAYMQYNERKIEDYSPSAEDLQRGFDTIPKLDGIQ